MPRCKANVDRLRGYRIKIYPTESQKISIQNVINQYRAIYNIALGIQNDNHFNGNSYIKYFDMCKLFSDMRNNNSNYAWMNSIQLSTIRQALRDLDVAFKNFFEKRSRYPRFKSKKRSKKFFTTRSDRTHVKGKDIRIPEIGLVNASNHTIPNGFNLYNCGISFDGYDYWFYCQIEKPIIEMNTEKTEAVGIDVGIRNMITTSNGKYYKFPNVQKLRNRIRRQDKRLSRYTKHMKNQSMLTKTKYEDMPKSKNMQKLEKKRFDTYKKIHNKIYNSINCATKEIVSSNPSAIVIENISATAQFRDHQWIRKFAPFILYYEIHRQLKYKASDRNIKVITASADFPSTKRCSNCSMEHEVYGNKIYKCPYCGLRIDRDLNAAINLKKLAY